MKNEIVRGYAGLLAEVKERVRAARYETLRAITKEPGHEP